MDSTTRKWIFDASDELAVRNGCWFDPLYGAYVVWWIERYCRLYEGEFAGDPMHLRGRHDEPVSAWDIPDVGPDPLDPDSEINAPFLARHEHFIDGKLRGVACDWQYYSLMRLFGWKRESPRWGRPVRRFRKAGFWVPKKNKKSPTLAAIGLYLTCGDGEQGQKVAFLAKDGSQAREIAGKHAMEMVKASPELYAECKLNMNECMVEHIPTRSFLKPFSSSNERNKEAKEGFNGSLLVDETHVVDRDFMKRMKRAGISRSEPIHLEVSTAGNNPDGYGKERFDYGADIAKGKIASDEFCYVAYAAPQDVEPSKLNDAEIIRLGKLANPAWDHTIGEDEYLNDWRESQAKTTETLDFLMYRLNIWQSFINRWLSGGIWDGCGDDFTLEEMYGQECCIGLDLSRTRDMTAAVLAFPVWDDNEVAQVRVWPHFWLPKDYAVAHRNDADFLEWAEKGFIQLTDGNEISTGEIYETVQGWRERFHVSGLFYDPSFATPITQLIEQGLNNAKGEQILPALDIPRTPIAQRGPEMSMAIDDVESMARSCRLRHPKNDVLTWQAGNVGIRDSGGRTVLAKPERDSTKKIDGMVAMVMAICGLKYCKPVHSKFEFEII